MRWSIPLLVPLIAALCPAVATAAPAIQFARAVDYPTGSSAWGPGPAAVGTMAGDFDRDGHGDVAVADFDGAGPLVMLGRGDGTFADGPLSAVSGGFSAAGKFAVAAQPQTPVTLDVDGDGRVDVAVAGSSRNLSVLRNIS